jgi:hypothetical protein
MSNKGDETMTATGFLNALATGLNMQGNKRLAPTTVRDMAKGAFRAYRRKAKRNGWEACKECFNL